MERQRCEEPEKSREEKREDQRRERARRKKMQVREKVNRWRLVVFLPLICGFGRSKSKPLKAAGAEPSGQMRDEKLHTRAAGNTFPSQNVKIITYWDLIWTFRCRFARQAPGIMHLVKSEQNVCGNFNNSYHYTTLPYPTLRYKYNYTTTNCIATTTAPTTATTTRTTTLLHHTTLHYTTLH